MGGTVIHGGEKKSMEIDYMLDYQDSVSRGLSSGFVVGLRVCSSRGLRRTFAGEFGLVWTNFGIPLAFYSEQSDVCL